MRILSQLVKTASSQGSQIKWLTCTQSTPRGLRPRKHKPTHLQLHSNIKCIPADRLSRRIRLVSSWPTIRSTCQSCPASWPTADRPQTPRHAACDLMPAPPLYSTVRVKLMPSLSLSWSLQTIAACTACMRHLGLASRV